MTFPRINAKTKVPLNKIVIQIASKVNDPVIQLAINPVDLQ